MKKFVTSGTNTYHLHIRGTGKILICLHGFSESTTTWDNLKLKNRKIICLDWLGHGKSDQPDEQIYYNFPNVISDLHEIIQKITNNEPFDLLGYSMGGRMALQYAIKHSERIDHLILESASSGLNSSEARENRIKSDENLAQKILQNGSEWFAEFWGNLALFNSQKSLSNLTKTQIYQRRASNSPHVLAATLRGTGQGKIPYVGNQIADLPLKILYISGSLDEKYRQIRQEFEQNPNVHGIEIAQAGHNTHLEKPEEFSEIIEEFLENS